jgi:DNA gyrase subunit A
VQAADQVTLITSGGVCLRTTVEKISQMSRMTRGVRIVTPDNGDTVAAMARLAVEVEEEPAGRAAPHTVKSHEHKPDPTNGVEPVDEPPAETIGI